MYARESLRRVVRARHQRCSKRTGTNSLFSQDLAGSRRHGEFRRINCEFLEVRTLLAAAPIAGHDSAVTVDDQPIVINVMANDQDPDVGGSIDISSGLIITPPQHGTAVFNPLSGLLSYDPFPGFVGQDLLLYTVKDADGVTSNVATVRIDVLPANTGPLAVNDLTGTVEDQQLVIDVLNNDVAVGIAIDPRTVEIVSPPTLGVANVNPVTGLIVYTPNPNVSGNDAFTYRVRNTLGVLSNVATVQLGIFPVADPPQTQEDSAVVAEDGTVAIPVLLNDTIPAPDTINAGSVQISTAPTKGLVTIAGGIVQYTPLPNVTGSDQFLYTVASTAGVRSAPTLVRIAIVGLNDPPVAVDDSGQLFEGTQSVFNVLANDFDIDNALDRSSVVITRAPLNGLAVVDPVTGAIFYTPNAGFFGNDTVQYRVRDISGAQSNIATLQIQVLEINDLPIAGNDIASTQEDTAVNINVVANDTDADDGIDPTTVEIIGLPANGTVSVNPSTGVVTYTPKANFAGSDAFSYVVRDLEGAVSNLATVLVNVQEVNDLPTLFDEEIVTDVNTPVFVPMLSNGFDLDGILVPSSITFVSSPIHGEVIVNPVTGDATYVPDPGFAGLDSFSYRARDDDGGLSNLATVTIRVGAPITIQGTVYQDLDNNGSKTANEPGIFGVEIEISKTDGPFTFTETVFTDANGNFSLSTSADFGILPPGTYSIREIQPLAHQDGIDTPGLPLPTGAVQNDRFNAIQLGSGATATGFLFGEGAVFEPLVGIVDNFRFYNAHYSPENGLLIFGSPTQNINLVPGPIFLAFNSGLQGVDQFIADFAPSPQFVSIVAYDQSFRPGVSELPISSTRTVLSNPGSLGTPLLLRVEGASPDVDLSIVPGAIPASIVRTVAPEDTVGAIDPSSTTFFLRQTNNSGVADIAPLSFQIGLSSKIPLVGDWDGDGIDTPGLYDRATAQFRLSMAGHEVVVNFGMPGWMPIVGDWNGDGKDTIGVYNPATAQFFLRNSNSTGVSDVPVFNYGLQNWYPIAGDWDGDGVHTVGVVSPTEAMFFLRNTNSVGVADIPAFNYGMPGWIPLSGDWDGDGDHTIAAYNPATAQYFLRNSNSRGTADVPVFNYGLPGWFPVAGRWTTGSQLLVVEQGQAPAGSTPATNVAAALPSLLAEAASRWVDAGAAISFDLSNIDVSMADLPNGVLGRIDGSRLVLDNDAAGWGWFVDETPGDDDEYELLAGEWLGKLPTTKSRVDLLSVLAHELGHLLGLDHDSANDDSTMDGKLPVGVRRLPA